MRFWKAGGLQRGSALLSVAAVALATTGILYAHWTTTLAVDGTVETGSIDIAWVSGETNDDNLDGFLDDGASPAPDYSGPAGDGSADPSSAAAANGTANFYTKDVARCTIDPAGDTLFVLIDNAYPSYWCSFLGDIEFTGTVPVKVAGSRLVNVTGPIGGDPFLDLATGLWTVPSGDPENPVAFHLKLDTSFYCGLQLDPGADDNRFIGSFHLDQGGAQNATYTFGIEFDFVNYNEWDPEMCDGGLLPDAPPAP